MPRSSPGSSRTLHRFHSPLATPYTTSYAAEGWLRRRVGFQPSLLALGLGSLAKLSIWDSLEQQWRLQGALVRVAPLRP